MYEESNGPKYNADKAHIAVQNDTDGNFSFMDHTKQGTLPVLLTPPFEQ